MTITGCPDLSYIPWGEQAPKGENALRCAQTTLTRTRLIVLMLDRLGLDPKQSMHHYVVPQSTSSERHRRMPLGVHFSLSGTPDGGANRPSAIDSTSKKLSMYKSKKRQVVSNSMYPCGFNRHRLTNAQMPSLLNHQEIYKPYAEVKSARVRSNLVQIARSFMDLDELFAAMFVQVIEASDFSTLSEMLRDIRHEISMRQATESTSKDEQDTYLGDLGQHCETLLKHYECITGALDVWSSPKDTASIPEFRNRKGSEQSLLEYLQDGFELPYWKIMLDAFSTSRSHQVTLGGNLIAMALISMRSKVCGLQCKLQRLLDSLPNQESVDDILVVINKRIELLHSFTDRVVSDADDDDSTFERSPTTMATPPGRSNSLNATIINIAMEGREHVRIAPPRFLARQLTILPSLHQPTPSSSSPSFSSP